MTTVSPVGLVHVEEVMGTTVTLDLRDECVLPVRRDRAVATAVASLHAADRVFSTWSPSSALLRARRGDDVTAREQHDLDTVERACRIARRLTRGWFDPWAMPGGYDPTGLVKGWAAARALTCLTTAGVAHAVVNAGGDLVTSGSARPGDEAGWRVGVIDPRRPSGLIGSVLARGVGVATSGGYERGSLAIDPSTGAGVDRLAAATVVAADLGYADAFASAACAQGPPALDWLARIPGVQALLITWDGGQLTTPGWAAATRWSGTPSTDAPHALTSSGTG